MSSWGWVMIGQSVCLSVCLSVGVHPQRRGSAWPLCRFSCQLWVTTMFVCYSAVSVWAKNCESLSLPDDERRQLNAFIDKLYSDMDDGNVNSLSVSYRRRTVCTAGLLKVSKEWFWCNILTAFNVFTCMNHDAVWEVVQAENFSEKSVSVRKFDCS